MCGCLIPIIPPASNRVDKSADVVAPYLTPPISGKDKQYQLLNDSEKDHDCSVIVHPQTCYLVLTSLRHTVVNRENG